MCLQAAGVFCMEQDDQGNFGFFNFCNPASLNLSSVSFAETDLLLAVLGKGLGENPFSAGKGFSPRSCPTIWISMVSCDLLLKSCRKYDKLFLISDNLHGKRVMIMIYHSTTKGVQLPKRLLMIVLTLLLLTAALLLTPVRVYASNIIDAGDYVYEIIEDGAAAKIIQYKGQSLYVSLPATVEDYPVTSIGSAAFMSNSTIKELEISGSIQQIESNAFYGCSSLQKLQVPGNVLYVGEGAFMNCVALHSVSIYDGTQAIGPYAFSGCTALKELKLPNSLKAIGRFAFFNCSSLEEVAIPKSVTEIGAHMLEATKWMQEQKSEFVVICDGVLIKYNGKGASKTVPKAVKTIGEFAFAENKELTAVKLPGSVSVISSNAFRNCKALKTITMTDSLTTIGSAAFFGCEALEDVILPKGISQIDGDTFNGCKSLRSMIIPASVSSIRYSAFSGCEALRELKLQNGLQTIENMAFYQCKSLGRIVFPESLKTLASLSVTACPSLTRVEFSGDTTISADAISDCPNLLEVVFFRNPTNVEDQAFSGSREVTLFSDNSLYVEEYAKRNRISNDNIRNLKSYTDHGILEMEPPREQSAFSGTYTLIVVIIILVDLALIILFSLYILFVRPRGRHARTKKEARAASGVPNRREPRHAASHRKEAARPAGSRPGSKPGASHEAPPKSPNKK